jgi:hydrogenase nickel incorporation protein HypA/HybF
MHELTAITRLIRQADAVARDQGCGRLLGLTVSVGALSHLSAETLGRLFPEAARGTPLEGARLHVQTCSDPSGEAADRLVLVSIDVED